MPSNEEVKAKYHELLESLKTQRDELNVKMHLASMEVRDEWQLVEDKWEHLRSKGAQLEKAAGSSAHKIGDAVGLLGQELKDGYRNIRKLL